ncbi:hypothetical protein [Flavobacterium caeni]|uniref:Phosphatidate cytidylyltransferase n=1 Tax=Flavobacterium caeni TaxID=490189 RepID=A0A1G5CSL7_9FLAO|nr:hypothetical protein [Flavobacterium caeni]SCY05297.1 hypothetical protein SAMN02927903_00629 [Flavobacterium caeni]
MSKRTLALLLLPLMLMGVTSCDVIEAIFEAGMAVGIFLVIAVIALIVFAVSKLGGSK